MTNTDSDGGVVISYAGPPTDTEFPPDLGCALLGTVDLTADVIGPVGLASDVGIIGLSSEMGTAADVGLTGLGLGADYGCEVNTSPGNPSYLGVAIESHIVGIPTGGLHYTSTTTTAGHTSTTTTSGVGQFTISGSSVTVRTTLTTSTTSGTHGVVIVHSTFRITTVVTTHVGRTIISEMHSINYTDKLGNMSSGSGFGSLDTHIKITSDTGRYEGGGWY